MASDKPNIQHERRGPVLILRLDRLDKRNAVNDAALEELRALLMDIGDDVRAIVLGGNGPHFCAGLDLAEQIERSPFETMMTSRRWHAVLDLLQLGGRPVIAALQGAVIGGGLELASAAHIRIADRTAFFQLPEGQRGIYIGGGGSVRIARLIGVSRMTELMLTGRAVDADQAERIGLVHILTGDGSALGKAIETAEAVAKNAPTVNYLILNALPRIADMSAADGLFTESLAAGLSQSSDSARAGIAAFLNRRAKPAG
jgi:enoyl-CoA hydratase/carnithine racemase